MYFKSIIKTKILSMSLLYLAIGNLNAQNEKTNRNEFVLKLPIDGESLYQQKIESTPYFVKDKVLQLYPGEKLFIEVEHLKKQIIKMSVVKKPINPDVTIEVSLIQNVKDGKSESMMLKISNPFKWDLKYKAMMFIVGQDKWILTNVLPVKANLSSIEIWNDVIITLVLSDWELQ
jgi:hypothetical protein